jgi:aminoglycoside 6'-N-acetyltransferase I
MAAIEPGLTGLNVRPLDASDLRAIEQHMLELTPLDRRARFLFQAKDTSITAYARRLDPLRDILIGAFDSSERLIGFAGAHADEEFRIVEIGITIDEDYRGRGLGRRLVALAMELAFARGAHSVHFNFSPDNHKFTRLVNALGGRIGIPVGHVEISTSEVRWKRWSLPPDQFTSPLISIRRVSNLDYAEWMRMRRLLWPDETTHGHDTAIDEILNAKEAWAFIAETDGTAKGFAEVSLRKAANGGKSRPVPFLEGVWVEPPHRRQGIGRGLIAHIEALLRAKGFDELGFGSLIENSSAYHAHQAWGFFETERVIYFRKSLCG